MPTSPASVSQLLWGTNFENVLNLGWPLDELVTGSLPRDGSEWAVGGTGLEDSWLTGTDFYLQGKARWFFPGDMTSPVLQSGYSGSRGMRAFLEYARSKSTFRFVPNINNPLFYVDNCYLVDPVDLTTLPTLEPDGTQQVPLLLRNATLDFGLALRGLMFEYQPGADVSPHGLNGTITQPGGRFLQVDGTVQNAAASVLRDRHYDLLGRRTTLIESARTNLLWPSEDLTNAQWTKTGATIGGSVTVPDGVTVSALVKVQEDTSTGQHGVSQSITVTAGNVVVLQGFFQPAERTQGAVAASAGTDFIQLNFDTSSGGSSATSVGGAGAVKYSRFISVGGGWWYYWISGVVNGSATSIACQFVLRSGGLTSYTGTSGSGGFYWGLHGEALPTTGSFTGTTIVAPAYYIKTTTAAVTRTTDGAKFPWPYLTQPMFIYVKYVFQGTCGLSDGQYLLGIGDFTNLRFLLYQDNAPNVIMVVNQNGNNISAGGSASLGAPVAGDIIEALGIVYPDMSVQVVVSKNGGADTVGARTGGVALSSGIAFPTPFVQLGGENGNTLGILHLIATKLGPGALGASMALARAA